MMLYKSRVGVLVTGLLLISVVAAPAPHVRASQPLQIPYPPRDRAQFLIPYLQQPTTPQYESTPGQSVTTSYGRWSKIVFQSYRNGNWEVYIADGDGGSQTRLTAHIASDVYPRLNRGGTRIVFASNRTGNYEIFAMNPDGGGITQLTFTSANEYSPSWSPDSTKIVFNSYRDGQSEIYVMSADGSGQTRLTNNAAYDGYPAWSPDGTKVAFISDRTSPTNTGSRIWVMNADGSGQTQVSTQYFSENPSWSPDGMRIAYDADGNGDGWQEIWLMNADGSGQAEAYDPPESETDAWVRSWSPDGRYIAFTRIRFIFYQGNWYWVNAYLDALDTGSGFTIRLSSQSTDWYPDWQTLDIWAPTSTMDTLSPVSSSPFGVNWTGSDTGPGGLQGYDVQMKDGAAGTWTDWLVNTTATSASYFGFGGHTYYFRSRARDQASNVEAWPGAADTWTTVEALPPTTFMPTLPPYSRGRVTVSWGGTDPGGSGIKTFDVQYQDVSVGTWVQWLNGATGTSADFTGTAGRTYAFRSRAIDTALNQGDWSSASGDTRTTFYRWALSGVARDSSHTPIAGAVVTTTPSWLGLIPSDSRALYTAYGVISASAYSATWGHAAYGQLPATQFQFNPSQDARFDIILPPHDNVVHNWGFETGSLGADDWTASGTPVPMVTDTFKHTGDFATWMGCTRLFEPALKLPGSTTATSIRATVDISGMLHITWRAQIDSTNADVYYVQRSSSGVWSGPANVSQSAAWSDDPRLALDDSGNVHVVWSEQSPGNYDIFYARKSNGIWSSPQNVSNTPGASGFPELVADRSGNVHIIWSEDSSSVGYVRQLSNGTWSSPATISGSTGGIYPRLVVDGAGTIHVIWEGTVGWNTDLFHAQRLASGIWSSPVNISNTAGPSVNAALFVEDNGTVHIVWSENGIHIYYAQRNTSGTWSRSVAIGSGLEPQIAVGADGVVHVVVDGSTYTQRQADGTWSAPYRFADGSASVIQTSAYDPRTTSTMMVLDNNRVLHYVWAASDDIFYSRRSENGGWLKPLNLSSSVAASYQPQIAVTADGAALVVWQDSKDYMPELSGMFFTHPAMAAQNNDSTLAQMVTVPVTAANPVLSFLYEYQTGHTSPISDNWLSVKVSNGATVTSLLTETSSVVAWEHRWFNVSRWKGQPITVTFGLRQVAGRPCNWFRLDEVSIGSWLTPVPLSVYPRRVSVRTPTVMTITGQNFIAIPPSPSYTQGPSVTLGSINLPDAQWINTNTLTATIPALDAGIYDLVVTNPGGQAGGLPRALLVDVRVYLPITLKQH